MVASSLQEVNARIHTAASAAGRPDPRLLAVAKTQPAQAIAALAAQGQRAIGENYVQEAAAHQRDLAALGPTHDLEWHLIGHLQSNKAREAATLFDWVQTLDRGKLIGALARHRPADRSPLNVLIQVNIDDESSKHGCAPGAVATLAAAVADEATLCLRGLMAIPAPAPDPAVRSAAFMRMRALFEDLRRSHASVDTLSMGMSDDLELAVAEGATMVRIGTALFGARPLAS
ncbi:MAG: YggS family pyridoxal phosphate-dependent enzyme [Pseudomonadota bacterium]|nr:YggS family pyridoxal phosphate-dependent enzyme [Pseudomonadota bacterium]